VGAPGLFTLLLQSLLAAPAAGGGGAGRLSLCGLSLSTEAAGREVLCDLLAPSLQALGVGAGALEGHAHSPSLQALGGLGAGALEGEEGAQGGAGGAARAAEGGAWEDSAAEEGAAEAGARRAPASRLRGAPRARGALRVALSPGADGAAEVAALLRALAAPAGLLADAQAAERHSQGAPEARETGAPARPGGAAVLLLSLEPEAPAEAPEAQALQQAPPEAPPEAPPAPRPGRLVLLLAALPAAALPAAAPPRALLAALLRALRLAPPPSGRGPRHALAALAAGADVSLLVRADGQGRAIAAGLAEESE